MTDHREPSVSPISESDFVVDAWSSLRSEAAAARWRHDPGLESLRRRFGAASVTVWTIDDVVRDLDQNQASVAIVNGSFGINPRFSLGNYEIDEVISACERFPERTRAAMVIEDISSIRLACAKIEEIAEHRLVAAVRVVPFYVDEPINSARLYPIYERCEGLGLPVTVNVGIPGPRARARYQNPIDLDDILHDFPDLTVIGAHMGNPWEAQLVSLMRKYERLYLSNSGYLATYFDPVVIRFMQSSIGRSRIIFASESPLIPLGRCLEAARSLDVDEATLASFLGHNAQRVFRLAAPGPAAAQKRTKTED